MTAMDETSSAMRQAPMRATAWGIEVTGAPGARAAELASARTFAAKVGSSWAIETTSS